MPSTRNNCAYVGKNENNCTLFGNAANCTRVKARLDDKPIVRSATNVVSALFIGRIIITLSTAAADTMNPM